MTVCVHRMRVMGAGQWARLRRERGENVVVVGAFFEHLPEPPEVVWPGMYGVCTKCLALMGGPWKGP